MLNRRKRRQGFSLIELLIVIAIILVIITIAVPNYQKIQMFTRETAAVQAIKTLQAAQLQYSSQFHRFANSLQELGPPASGTANEASAGLIDNTLAAGEKQGYKFVLTGANGGYSITAMPVNFGISGSKSYFTDESMIIRENFGREPATASSKELK